jgi:pimeloyl-ACP methyl ester carboxylesterase
MERQQIDIGGVALDAVLSGHGNVTVIFENGLATSLEEWDGVVEPIAARARTLRYDRRRAPAIGPVPVQSAADLAGDLAKLLAALKLSPPYVLVGHSWGGAIARVFARRHPSDVVGLVLVDATHEAIDSAGLTLLPAFYALLGVVSRPMFVRRRLVPLFCPTAAPASYRSRVERTMADPARWALTLRTARSESAGIRVSLAALRRDCAELPPVPVHVLTARAPTGAGAKSARRVHEAWEAMVAQAPNARLTKVPTSSHHMTLDAPDIVTRAITDVLDVVDPARPATA